MKFSRKALLGTAAGIIVVAVALVAALFFLPQFQVSKFEITGNTHTTAGEIEDATNIAPGTPLIQADTVSAAKSVAALPWVAKVSVDRSYPNAVQVKVEERQAMLFAQRDDGPHLVDATGRPFIIDTPPPGCVEVTGTKEDNPALFQDVVTIISALDPGARAQLERVDAPSKFEFRLFFAGAKEVYWGSVEQAHDKAKATSTVIQREGNRWNVSAPGMVTMIP